MVLQARTFEQVLLLARRVLCSDLLTIDTLHRHTLVVLYIMVEPSACVNGKYQVQSILVGMDAGLYSTGDDNTTNLPLALNSTNAACTSESIVRPMASAPDPSAGEDAIVTR